MKCVNKRGLGGKAENNRKGKQQESINTAGNTNTEANKQRCRYSGFKCRCRCIFQRISKHIKSKANGRSLARSVSWGNI